MFVSEVDMISKYERHYCTAPHPPSGKKPIALTSLWRCAPGRSSGSHWLRFWCGSRWVASF